MTIIRARNFMYGIGEFFGFVIFANLLIVVIPVAFFAVFFCAMALLSPGIIFVTKLVEWLK